MKIDMKMKLMREVEENIKNIAKQVDEADKKFEKADQKVKDITKNQENELHERLAKRKKRLRKKSAQIVVDKLQLEGDAEVIPEPPIKKEELVEAQRQLTQAIIKFTIRMTNKQKDQAESAKKQGRIKMNRIDDVSDEDDPEQEAKTQESSAMKKQGNQGRIKTKRAIESEESESQYF